jgi:hypothetical protein
MYELCNKSSPKFWIFNAYYTSTRREGAILESPCPSVCPFVHTFVTDISASTGRNYFIFDMLFIQQQIFRVISVLKIKWWLITCKIIYLLFVTICIVFGKDCFPFVRYFKSVISTTLRMTVTIYIFCNC